MATSNPGDLPEQQDPLALDLSGLLGAAIGKNTTQTTNSGQTTNAVTNTNTNAASTVNGTQSQSTGGSTLTQGSQGTSGTVNNNTQSTQTTSTDAELAGLRDVYARQSAGITPDMLQAIFREGSKAAPQLVTTTANALGARAEGNTPLAAAMTQLNSDLTSKAADVNRQLLTDAGNTAGRIAELTKRTSQTGSSLQQQVQDLLTKNDSTSIVNQLMTAINNQNTNQNTNTTGTQTQQVNATENKNTRVGINTNVVKNLGAFAAAGLGINELFKLATGKGFIGNLQDFTKYLRSAGFFGGSLGGGSVPQQPYDPNNPGSNPGEGDPPPPEDNPSDDYAPGDADGGIQGYADGGNLFLPSPDLIKKTPPKGNPDADIDGMASSAGGLSGMLASVLGGGSSSGGSPASGDDTFADAGGAGGPGSGSSGGTGASTSGSGTSVGIGTVGNNSPSIGAAISAALGQQATPQGVAQAFTNPVSALIGLLSNVVTNMNQQQNQVDQLNKDAQEAIAFANQNEATPTISDPDATADAANTDSEGQGSNAATSDGPSNASGDDGGGGSSSGDSGDGEADGGIQRYMADGGRMEPTIGTKAPIKQGGTGGGLSSEALRRISLAGSLPLPRSYDSTEVTNPKKALVRREEEANNYADGGTANGKQQGMSRESVNGNHRAALLGIRDGDQPGSLMFDNTAVEMLHHALTMTQVGGPDNYAEGGKIKGPGSGISDSIPAKGPGGRPMRVANGEYIIPADVVQKFGVQAFDDLLATHHVPADLQRAMGLS